MKITKCSACGGDHEDVKVLNGVSRQGDFKYFNCSKAQRTVVIKEKPIKDDPQLLEEIEKGGGYQCGKIIGG